MGSIILYFILCFLFVAFVFAVWKWGSASATSSNLEKVAEQDRRADAEHQKDLYNVSTGNHADDFNAMIDIMHKYARTGSKNASSRAVQDRRHIKDYIQCGERHCYNGL